MLRIVMFLLFVSLLTGMSVGGAWAECEGISEAQARSIAQGEIEKDTRNVLVLYDALTKEYPFGWAFTYTTREWLETHDSKYILLGAGPLIVNRDGSVVRLGSSRPPDVAIDGYLNQWLTSHKACSGGISSGG